MTTKKKVRILSLDGGGMRGIIPATIIKYAEEYLQKKAPGTTIADHFDMIAGTSTGGILTGIYLAPDPEDKTKARYSAAEALDFYVKEGYNIFNASQKPAWRRLWGLTNATEYSPKNLERLLKENFEDLQMHELLKPCLITTYNLMTKCSFFFTSMEDTDRRKFFVRDVLRSTSAAPTYFPPARIKNKARKPDAGEEEMVNIDGGVFANNPWLCAYAEVHNTDFPGRNHRKPGVSNMYTLSLGTGGGDFELPDLKKANTWGLLQWATAMPEIMMDGAVDTVAYQMKQMYDTLDQEAIKGYLRVDVPQDARIYDSDMSNASPENVEKLQKAGEMTLEEAKKNGLDTFLDGLLDEQTPAVENGEAPTGEALNA